MLRSKSSLLAILALIAVLFIGSLQPSAAQDGVPGYAPPPPDSLPNGVAAGDLHPDSAVLWARSTAPGTLRFEWSTDPGFDFGTRHLPEVHNPLLPVIVQADNLQPGTQYYYRVTDAAGAVVAGSFRTPHDMGQQHGLRFGVSGDWRGELAPYPAIRNAAGRDLDFFVALGDTIYADVPSPAVPAQQATTFEEFRLKYAEGYGTRYGVNTWAELRSSTAIFATIDDHEVANDFAGGAAPASDPRFAEYAGTFINQTALYQNALTAFLDFHPLYEIVYAGINDPRVDERPMLYRYQPFGSDAAIFITDARSFRDAPLTAPDNVLDFGAVGDFLEEAATPGRSMLGKDQLVGLRRDLRAAQEAGITWKFVFISQPVQNFGPVAAPDRYEGYAWERDQLLGFIHENGITNVVFVAADFHGTLVNDLVYGHTLREDGTPLAAFEITTGSVAYDAPFGPTTVGLAAEFGLISEEQFAAYASMSLAEQDAFAAGLLNPQLALLGYPRLGLGDDDLIDEELLQGAYTVISSYGWTEFEIDAETQDLLITTYGIAPYSQAELEADPEGILARQPQIMGQFVVRPQ